MAIQKADVSQSAYFCFGVHSAYVAMVAPPSTRVHSFAFVMVSSSVILQCHIESISFNTFDIYEHDGLSESDSVCTHVSTIESSLFSAAYQQASRDMLKNIK